MHFFYQILTPAEFNRLWSSAKPSKARPSRAKRGQRRKAPGSRRRPPSLARASNKSTDASLLAATELVASKHLSSAGKRALHERDFRRPKSRRVRLLLPGGFTLLKWFPLRPPRTKRVSVCKTRHSRAEVLISVTLRVGGGFAARGRPIFHRQNKYFLCSP